MNIIQAIILGIIQGLSEFLPISSTAHMTIAGELMKLNDLNNPEHWTAFIAVIQLGTLIAVLAYFAKDILNIFKSFFAENFSNNKASIKNQTLSSKLGWFIIVGTIPIVVLGYVLKKIIEGNLTKDPIVIASSLIGLALILFLAERTSKFKKELKDISVRDAFWVGLAQCVALIPGSSRSGTTITAGLFLGMTRETAARFSFLLSIPAVLISGLYEFYKSMKYINGHDMINLAVGIVVSFIVGYIAIGFLLKFLKTNSTLLFIIYRIALGLGIIYMVYSKIL